MANWLFKTVLIFNQKRKEYLLTQCCEAGPVVPFLYSKRLSGLNSTHRQSSNSGIIWTGNFEQKVMPKSQPSPVTLGKVESNNLWLTTSDSQLCNFHSLREYQAIISSKIDEKRGPNSKLLGLLLNLKLKQLTFTWTYHQLCARNSYQQCHSAPATYTTHNCY